VWALAVACSDPVSPNARVENIEKLAADGVTFAYGSNAAFAPTVRLTDAKGNPVRGATVRFEPPTNGFRQGPVVTVTSDGNGIAVGPAWTPRYVGANELWATVDDRLVTFTAIGRCIPARTLVAGEHVAGTLDAADCTERSAIYDFSFNVFHDRFALVLPSQQSVKVAWTFAPDATGGAVLLYDARHALIGWEVDGPRLWAILPAGHYELDASSSESVSDVYTLNVERADTDVGCNLPFLLRGVQFSRELGPLDCTRTEEVTGYRDSYVLVLLRGEATTVHLASADFEARLEIWRDVNDGRETERTVAVSEAGAPARIVHACAEDRCHVRIVATSRESVRTGGYTLTVE
jgi:hypothetical protein